MSTPPKPDAAASHSALGTQRSAFPLVLIGYRGAGKTTVAQQLALALGWEWIDADVEVELRAGKSIAAIFADDGEQVFRDWEAQTLADSLRRERVVLAAGGGVSSGWPAAESHQVVMSPVSGLTRTIAGVSPMLQT